VQTLGREDVTKEDVRRGMETGSLFGRRRIGRKTLMDLCAWAGIDFDECLREPPPRIASAIWMLQELGYHVTRPRRKKVKS